MKANVRKAHAPSALLILAGCFVGSAVLRVGDALTDASALASSAEPEPRVFFEQECPFDGAPAEIVAQLQKQERDIDKEKEELKVKKNELAELNEQIQLNRDKLNALARQIQESSEYVVSQQDIGLQRLVTMYENMKTKQASEIFEVMDPKIAAEILARMNTEAAAKILGGLTPEKAYQISISITE